VREIQTPQNATNTGLVECALHLICESPASIWNCRQICIEDSIDKRMAQSSNENVRSLRTKNTGKREWILWSIFTNFHLLRGSLESPVKITRVRSER
jgi:hypothetical protein